MSCWTSAWNCSERNSQSAQQGQPIEQRIKLGLHDGLLGIERRHARLQFVGAGNGANLQLEPSRAFRIAVDRELRAGGPAFIGDAALVDQQVLHFSQRAVDLVAQVQGRGVELVA